ncbi:hypothetical protein E5288_WYG013801 [Bos mutus]|uniref:Retinal cone rhodopsin-sensitive cGMP 3',5'-cyclic phosphodiesterase subunit gamma n=1 Tax=Bos mutus TaxID=72004 RepID=A0A6B0QQI5_9CETA|nr:hypothetical protein [Bos mutus]
MTGEREDEAGKKTISRRNISRMSDNTVLAPPTSNQGPTTPRKGPPKFKQRQTRQFKSKPPKKGVKGFGDDIPGMEGLGTGYIYLEYRDEVVLNAISKYLWPCSETQLNKEGTFTQEVHAVNRAAYPEPLTVETMAYGREKVNVKCQFRTIETWETSCSRVP